MNSEFKTKNVSYTDVFPSTNSTLSIKTVSCKQKRRCSEIRRFSYEKAYLAIIENGRAFANKRTSAVITSNNQLLAALSQDVSLAVATSEHLPEPYFVNGSVAFLHCKWNQAYFHWVMEILPRIELLIQGGVRLDEIEKFVFYQPDKRFHIETLDIVGIPRSKIVDSFVHPHISANQLLVPSQMSNCKAANWAINSWKGKVLKYKAYPFTNNFGKRIYISRKLAKRRRVVNEEEVVEFLSKKGFSVVTLESMSILEQAFLLSEVDAIIAPHGAGLTNILFSNRGTKVIELFNSIFINRAYQKIASQCGLDYYYLASEVPVSVNSKPLDADIFVEIDCLNRLLIMAGLS